MKELTTTPTISFKNDGIMDNSKNRLKCQVETITPEIAREYLKFNKINRPLNKSTVNFYAKEMANGEWKLNGEAICFQGNVLVNGQHRLQACIQSNIPFRTVVVRGVEENSFTTYDSGRLRTNADVFSLMDIKNASTVASSIVKYIALKRNVASIEYRASQDKGRNKASKDELLKVYNQCPQIFDNAAERSKRLCNFMNLINVAYETAIIVYLIYDLHHPTKKVYDFFEMLHKGEAFTNRTIKILRDKLISDKINMRSMKPIVKQMIIFKTWNCYVKNVELQRLGWREGKEERITLI